MAWNKAVPASGSNIVDIPTIFSNNWAAIQTAFGHEHYSLNVSASGSHLPGYVGIMYSGATSAITAISAPDSGALAWDTTIGVVRRYTGAVWEVVEDFLTTRIQVYRNGDFTVGSSATSAMPYDTEVVDSLGEWDNTSYVFTALADGAYWVRADANVTPVTGGDIIRLTIKHLDSGDAVKYTVESRAYSLSSNSLSMREAAILYLAAGEKIKVYISHTYTDNLIVEGGSDLSFLSIVRVS